MKKIQIKRVNLNEESQLNLKDSNEKYKALMQS